MHVLVQSVAHNHGSHGLSWTVQAGKMFAQAVILNVAILRLLTKVVHLQTVASLKYAAMVCK